VIDKPYRVLAADFDRPFRHVEQADRFTQRPVLVDDIVAYRMQHQSTGILAVDCIFIRCTGKPG
jgi:hypothetical protein